MTLQVFISYHHEYLEFARKINSQLHGWGYETWLDKEKIKPSTYFRDAIQDGLENSDILIGIITDKAQKSREVMAEIDYFLSLKKPLVPFKFEDIKMRYIFVTIQYIDYVEKGEEQALAELKELLTELAQSTVESLSGDTLDPELVGGKASETEEAILDDFLREKSEQKKEAIEDGLFGAPALSTENAPVPQPAPPPKPITPPSAPGSVASQPATPIFQPSRQQDYMPQPAALGRKRSSPMLWSLGAVASLIIVVGAVVLFSSNAALSTSGQPQGTSPLVWVSAVAVVGVIGVFGWRWFVQSKTSAIPGSSPTDDAQNRATMLQNVEDYWLKGVLDPALEAGTFEMGLSAAPGALLRHKDYGDYELPANANILDVFNDLNRELLILGAPGGGKTVLLLQLARELIQQARQDSSKAIPVVLNLSSWAAERKSLADWLVDELRQKYQMPKKVATAWVEGEKLLLLLDGLDEVAEQYRNECVEAINAFRQQYRTVDLAICSRIADYDALTSKLDVRGAIVLEPLSQQVIEKYLDRPELASLRQVMAGDKDLQVMSQVPFLLNAMAYAYAGATPNNFVFPANDDTAKARRTHLFNRWVEKRLEARPISSYKHAKINKWLGWLAGKIVMFKRIVFYIEELQPIWITENNLLYQMVVGLASGTIGGLGGGLAGLLIGTLAGAVVSGLTAALTAGMTGGLVGALAGALAFGLSIGLTGRKTGIKLAEKFTWRFTMVGLAAGLAFGLVAGLALGLATALVFKFTFGLAFGLTLGLVSGLIVGMAFGMQPVESITSRRQPNQGIIQSAFNALQSTVAVALIFGLIIGLSGRLVGGLADGIAVGIAGGLVGGLIFGLPFGGGEAVIKHLIIRLFLWRNDNAPWNYARFLDYCVNARLMRKVGGGYIFAHRYLMEYFAELEIK